ncbi:cutinase family protein [Corynebacterium sp. p3-SID1056]|uniref:cutinase family protein n=1 Tax=Corynebacterium sp. p3-SID1056 TaxID=2916092 RepID=UPI0021A3CEF4|nr:cutinase family protein [Corynebacterium sp. p3-SID1056]MCT2338156.1 cutinase family protein [Corynebacterium sp. p3-SID1056]
MKHLAALTLATLVPLAPVAQAQPWDLVAPSCTPVHVVQAAGSGFSHSWDPSARESLFDDHSSPAADLTEHFGTRTVRTYQVRYPASLGRFSALGSSSGGIEGTEAATYGESVTLGADDAAREIRTVARNCPDTRLILIGYSQGAHLIGDVAAEIGHGKVAGVGPDQVAAVVLFADPGRSGVVKQRPLAPAKLYAPAPKGQLARGGELINGGGSGVVPGRVGLAGERALSFAGLEGKVLSLCNAADMACSTDPDSALRELADVAMREEVVGPPNAATGMHVLEFSRLMDSGAPLQQAVRESGLSLLDAPTAALILGEIGLFAQAADRATRAEQAATPAEQLAAVTLMSALPNLAKEGVTWTYLLPALEGLRGAVATGEEAGWYDVALEAMRATQAAERFYLQLASAGVVARVPTPTEQRQAATHAAVSQLMDQVASAAGLNAAMRNPANANLLASAAQAGDFGPRHMSYYKLGYTDSPGGFSIDGQTGYDYALDWLDDVVRGVLREG